MLPLAALLATSIAATPALSPAAMRDLAREVVTAPDYQTSLPTPDDDGVVDPDPRLRRGGGEVVPDEEHLELHREPTGLLAFLGRWLIYIVIAAVIVVLVFWLVTELGGYQREPKRAAPTPPTPHDLDHLVSQPLGDADALAQAGRFAEAIHTLLLRTLEELVRRRAQPLPRSLTSREILGRVELPEQARAALSGLVSATELCWFGGALPGAADYQVCVERFRGFAAAYSAGVAS